MGCRVDVGLVQDGLGLLTCVQGGFRIRLELGWFRVGLEVWLGLGWFRVGLGWFRDGLGCFRVGLVWV